MHYASPSFWDAYAKLPETARKHAHRNFGLLKSDTRHRSLVLKRVGRYWSIRAGGEFRALAVEIDDGLLWFWIGPHAEYDRLIK